MTTAITTTERMATVRVVLVDDVLTHTGKRVLTVDVEPGTPLAIVVWSVLRDRLEEQRGTTDPRTGPCHGKAEPVMGDEWNRPVVVHNGAVVEELDQAGGVHDGDQIVLAPRHGDPTTIVLLMVGLALTAASALLATRPSLTAGGGDNAARRFAFGRFSQDATAGDPIPVVFGSHKRYGGKVIAKVWGTGADGDSRLKLLIALGEGPFSRIGNQAADADDVAASALSGVYMNDQPIGNFPRCVMSVRMGTGGQAVMPGFGDVEIVREVGVGGTLLRNTSGTERTGGSASGEAVLFSTLDNVNAVVARIRFAKGLYSVSANGQTNARLAKYRLRTRTSDVGAGAGSWSAWTVVSLARAEQSEITSAKRMDGLSGGGGAKMDVQVERVSIEPSSVGDVDEMRFDETVEVRYSAQTYAGVAVVGLELVASEQLTSVPRVSFDVDGYAGLRIWDGSSPATAPVFSTGFSRNAAWQVLALLTDTTWGMGATYGDAAVDFQSLFDWATRNDETVVLPGSLGGGTRKRHACNIVMGEQKDGIEWLRTICRSARAIPVPAGNVWRFVADVPRAVPVEVFGDGDIAVSADGEAEITWQREMTTGGLTTPNRLTASFDNANADGRADVAVFPAYGAQWLGSPLNEPVREENLKLEGITDPHEATAQLVYLLKRMRGLSRSVEFTTSKGVVAVQPGDRFDLATSLVGWGLASGRVAAGCTVDAVRLDREVTLAAGTEYAIEVCHEDGTVESRTINSPGGGYYAAGDAIGLTAPFAAAPAEFEGYSVGQAGLVRKPFICTRLAPVAGDAGAILWQISGLEYAAGVYDDDPGEVVVPPYGTIRTTITPPGPVTDLKVSERTVDGRVTLELSWSQTAEDRSHTESFRVYRRLIGTTTWVLVPEPRVSSRSFLLDIRDPDEAFEFCVVAVTSGGAALSPYDPRVLIVSVVFGLAAPPPGTVADLALSQIAGNRFTLSWAATEGAVEYQVLASVYQDGVWDCYIVRRVTGTSTEVELCPNVDEQFFVRAVGVNGRMSETAAGVDIGAGSVPSPPGMAIKDQESLPPNLSGSQTGLTNNSGDSLDLSGGDEGTWTSGVMGSGVVTVTRLTVQVLSQNVSADPLLSDDPFRIPSLQADQWVTVGGGPVYITPGMPPYPDDELTYTVEVRTNDGTYWTPWEVLPHYTAIERIFGTWQVRVKLKRLHAPNLPRLRVVNVVTMN